MLTFGGFMAHSVCGGRLDDAGYNSVMMSPYDMMKL